ncbi:MAG: cysteine--tRNA ligase [Myxococcales bacterium]|nr:cysteine--tRNA ligase [Myxococcales bacterium]
MSTAPSTPSPSPQALPTVSLFDSQQQKKVPLVPCTPGHVRMYVCGPTVYNLFHIGNARPFVVFDVVARHLRARGYRVTLVCNVTDVDDKIIHRAQELGEDPSAFAARFTDEYHRDRRALGCLPPDVEPRATEHIAEMQHQIQQLLDRGLAYVVDGDVYYAVNQFPGYGELSRLPREELLAGARKEVDPRKRDAADFALWKAAKPGEPSWPSPWGNGRPGWHIECSAMSEKYLGPVFDLHGGGIDLRFPHHENERAQAQGVHGPHAFSRLWMHNGFVGFRWVHSGQVMAEGSKIAKSDVAMRPLYHAFVARTCIERHGGEAVRLWLLTTIYRNPITFDVDMAPPTPERSGSPDAAVRTPGLEEAERRLEYGYLTVLRLDEALAVGKPVSDGPVWSESEGWLDRLLAALDDDFNTPVALSEWQEGLGLANRVLDGKITPPLAKDVRRRTLERLRADLRRAASVLGLLESDPAAYLSAHRIRRVAARGLDQARIESLIADREAARRSKDFARADSLRGELLTLGVEVMDTPTGPRWRVQDQAQAS